MVVASPVYYCEQAIVRREGNHYIVKDRSNGQLVGERVYSHEAMLSLADQAVRAVTSPPTAEITPLPPR